MRIICFLFLQFSFIFSLAQSTFPSQLKAIIADSINKLQKYKTSFKELQVEDSVYHSSLNVVGTKQNDIVITKQMKLYRAVVIDSITEKSGRKIVDEWQEKIKAVLGQTFTLGKTRIVSWNPSKYGWKFSQGNVSVSIDLYPYNMNSKLYWVCLGITYFSLETFSQ